ncbi:hypothetical protein Btru_047773 [Bulinus truncatus]|nr:hypothetical protein Btru_047773 [Bulinus truncatus]
MHRVQLNGGWCELLLAPISWVAILNNEFFFDCELRIPVKELHKYEHIPVQFQGLTTNPNDGTCGCISKTVDPQYNTYVYMLTFYRSKMTAKCQGSEFFCKLGDTLEEKKRIDVYGFKKSPGPTSTVCEGHNLTFNWEFNLNFDFKFQCSRKADRDFSVTTPMSNEIPKLIFQNVPKEMKNAVITITLTLTLNLACENTGMWLMSLVMSSVSLACENTGMWLMSLVMSYVSLACENTGMWLMSLVMSSVSLACENTGMWLMSLVMSYVSLACENTGMWLMSLVMSSVSLTCENTGLWLMSLVMSSVSLACENTERDLDYNDYNDYGNDSYIGIEFPSSSTSTTTTTTTVTTTTTTTTPKPINMKNVKRTTYVLADFTRLAILEPPSDNLDLEFSGAKTLSGQIIVSCEMRKTASLGQPPINMTIWHNDKVIVTRENTHLLRYMITAAQGNLTCGDPARADPDEGHQHRPVPVLLRGLHLPHTDDVDCDADGGAHAQYHGPAEARPGDRAADVGRQDAAPKGAGAVRDTGDVGR